MKSEFTKLSILKAFLTVSVLFCSSSSYAVIDTLKYYDPSAGLYYVTGYPYQIQRFIPAAPGSVQSIMLILGGSTGTAKLHLYGSEGGADAPYILKDLIPPLNVNKSSSGNQTITVPLPSSYYVANTQFYIAVTELSAGVVLFSDNYTKPESCSSTTGGDYYQMYYVDSTGAYGYDVYSFAIGVIIDYDYATSPSYYKDVTASVGIDTNVSSRSIAWGDINKDGYEDFIAGGRLYKNNGNGTFTEITSSAGLPGSASVNAFVDMNNDSLLDILIIRDYVKNSIFINNGNETFTEHPLSNMMVDTTTLSFSIADYNNDKYPDLFLGQLWKNYPTPLPNYLYSNDHNLGFTNVSTLLYPANGSQDKQTYASMFVDFDNDGDEDLYVSNYYLQRDELWQNNGNGTFTNIVAAKNIDINSMGVSGHGTGVDWADYDNDGDMDLLLPQLAHPAYLQPYDYRSTTIYRNEGPPGFAFTDLIGQQLNNPGLAGQGIEYEETQAGGEFGDIDNDGLQDIFLTAYYGCRYVKLYTQKPDHTFQLKTFDYGLDHLVHAADAVFADYDNDGKLDLATGDENNHLKLFKNTTTANNNYVEIDLKSISQNDFAIGARVTVYAGGQKYTREVSIGQGEGVQRPYRQHFGLGLNNTIDSVTVRWPNHTNTQKFTNLNVNHIYTLTEVQINASVNDIQKTIAADLLVSPNPFKDELTLNYSVNDGGNVKIEVYSLIGQKVKTLVDEPQQKGNYSIRWNAKDDTGNKLPSGFYLVFLKQHDTIITRKAIHLAE